MMNLRDDFERQRNSMESLYRNQIEMLHKKQARELQKLLQREIETGNRSYFDKYKNLCEEKHVKMTNFNKNKQKELEDVLISKSEEHTKKYIKHHTEVYKKHEEWIQQKLDETLLKRKAPQVGPKFPQNLSEKEVEIVEKERPWNNNFVPEEVKKQLNALHDRHKSEVDRLQKEIDKQHHQKLLEERKARIVVNKEIEMNLPGLNVIDTQHVIGQGNENTNLDNVQANQLAPLFQRSSRLLSPRPALGTTWNSRTLFGRTNPSPVATVLPQRHETAYVQERRQQAPVLFQPQNRFAGEDGHQMQSQAESRSKIQVQAYAEKELSRPSGMSRQIVTHQSSRESSQSVIAAEDSHMCSCIELSEKVQEKRTRKNSRANSSRQPQRRSQRLSNVPTAAASNTNDSVAEVESVSPVHSEDSSRNSSPAVSITEVFIKRRVRNERPGADIPGVNRDCGSIVKSLTSDSDFLNTPNLTNDETSRAKSTTLECFSDLDMKLPRRNLGEKRKLFCLDSQLELFFKQSSKRRKMYATSLNTKC